MATAKPSAKLIPPPPPENGTLAAVLSFMVPGLGQVLQGRIAKGLLFFCCVYALFFYGMYLGSGSVTLTNADREVTYHVTGNVYLPDTAAKNNPWNLTPLLANLYNRPQYLGQFWVGVVAWPALYQYAFPGKPDKPDAENLPGVWTEIKNFEKTPSEESLNAVNTSGDKLLDLAFMYPVITRVLN